MSGTFEGVQPEVWSGARDIVNALEARRSELTHATKQAITDEIPGYGAVLDKLGDDLERHIEAHFNAFLSATNADRTVDAEDLSFIHQHAMLRARIGLSLGDFLHAFRVGHRVLWSAMLEEAEKRSDGPRAALALATPWMRYVDFASTGASEAYFEAHRYLAVGADRLRRDLIEDLLAGRPPTYSSTQATAEELGLVTNAQALLVVAEAAEPLEDVNVLHTAAAALARSMHADRTPLSAVRNEEVVIVAAIGEGTASSMCEMVGDARARLANEGIPLSVGISTPTEGVEGIPTAYREAREALRRVPAGGGLEALPTRPLFEYLAMAADTTARRLVDGAVRKFIEQDREAGGRMIETLRAVAAADLNLRRASEEMFVHENTMHYRLSRITERTGRNPRHLDDLIDLLTAIEVLEANSPRRDNRLWGANMSAD